MNQAGDIVDIIQAQHDQVRALFGRLDGLTGDAAEEPFCELRRMLAVHEVAEEEIVYPAVRATGEQGESAAKARMDEEDKAKTALSDLEKIGPSAPEFASKLAAFQTMVEAHASAEEREIFPLLRSIAADRRESMAGMFIAAEEAAPTHPHPHGPESAAGNIILGPAVAIMDKVRDAIRGRTG